MVIQSVFLSASLNIISLLFIFIVAAKIAFFAGSCFNVMRYSSLLCAHCMALISSLSTYFTNSSSLGLPLRVTLNTTVNGLWSAGMFKRQSLIVNACHWCSYITSCCYSVQSCVTRMFNRSFTGWAVQSKMAAPMVDENMALCREWPSKTFQILFFSP